MAFDVLRRAENLLSRVKDYRETSSVKSSSGYSGVSFGGKSELAVKETYKLNENDMISVSRCENSIKSDLPELLLEEYEEIDEEAIEKLLGDCNPPPSQSSFPGLYYRFGEIADRLSTVKFLCIELMSVSVYSVNFGVRKRYCQLAFQPPVGCSDSSTASNRVVSMDKYLLSPADRAKAANSRTTTAGTLNDYFVGDAAINEVIMWDLMLTNDVIYEWMNDKHVEEDADKNRHLRIDLQSCVQLPDAASSKPSANKTSKSKKVDANGITWTTFSSLVVPLSGLLCTPTLDAFTTCEFYSRPSVQRDVSIRLKHLPGGRLNQRPDEIRLDMTMGEQLMGTLKFRISLQNKYPVHKIQRDQTPSEYGSAGKIGGNLWTENRRAPTVAVASESKQETYDTQSFSGIQSEQVNVTEYRSKYVIPSVTAALDDALQYVPIVPTKDVVRVRPGTVPNYEELLKMKEKVQNQLSEVGLYVKAMQENRIASTVVAVPLIPKRAENESKLEHYDTVTVPKISASSVKVSVNVDILTKLASNGTLSNEIPSVIDTSNIQKQLRSVEPDSKTVVNDRKLLSASSSADKLASRSALRTLAEERRSHRTSDSELLMKHDRKQEGIASVARATSRMVTVVERTEPNSLPYIAAGHEDVIKADEKPIVMADLVAVDAIKHDDLVVDVAKEVDIEFKESDSIRQQDVGESMDTSSTVSSSMLINSVLYDESEVLNTSITDSVSKDDEAHHAVHLDHTVIAVDVIPTTAVSDLPIGKSSEPDQSVNDINVSNMTHSCDVSINDSTATVEPPRNINRSFESNPEILLSEESDASSVNISVPSSDSSSSTHTSYSGNSSDMSLSQFISNIVNETDDLHHRSVTVMKDCASLVEIKQSSLPEEDLSLQYDIVQLDALVTPTKGMESIFSLTSVDSDECMGFKVGEDDDKEEIALPECVSVVNNSYVILSEEEESSVSIDGELGSSSDSSCASALDDTHIVIPPASFVYDCEEVSVTEHIDQQAEIIPNESADVSSEPVIEAVNTHVDESIEERGLYQCESTEKVELPGDHSKDTLNNHNFDTPVVQVTVTPQPAVVTAFPAVEQEIITNQSPLGQCSEEVEQIDAPDTPDDLKTEVLNACEEAITPLSSGNQSCNSSIISLEPYVEEDSAADVPCVVQVTASEEKLKQGRAVMQFGKIPIKVSLEEVDRELQRTFAGIERRHRNDRPVKESGVSVPRPSYGSVSGDKGGKTLEYWRHRQFIEQETQRLRKIVQNK